MTEKEEPKVDYVFCLPGNASSTKQWLNLHVVIMDLIMMRKVIGVAHSTSCNIYTVRNSCLAMKGMKREQRPFEGKYDGYEKMIWVDSDNLITTPQVLRLLSHDVDMVGGWYRMYSAGAVNDDNNAACGSWQHGDGKNEIRPFRVGEIPNMPTDEKGLIEVDYAGFGCMAVKNGVFEAFEYPWFQSWLLEWEHEGERYADIMTDDSGFCFRARQKGFKVYIDPAVRLPHEKKVGV
jgi:hypothetical protein